jgi:serine phosphatase RsbU (regulator of sigma subunit)
MQIASVGHMPPYLRGQEMNLEGSLPLGLSSDADASVQTFTLQPGDFFTFIIDRVVEAMNPAQELFGFERTRKY